jgi:hypothetical protein
MSSAGEPVGVLGIGALRIAKWIGMRAGTVLN